MPPLLGLLLASVITLTLTALHLPRLASLERQRFDNGSATQFAEFTRAAERYLVRERQNLVAGFAAMPGSDPRSFTASDLVATGDLSRRFRDRNTFGQRHALIITADAAAAGHVEGLAVTWGGEAMSRGETVRLAQNAGARAGLVHPGREREVWGASGQWQAGVDEFTGGLADSRHRPAVGHLAALLSTRAAPPPAGLAPVGIVTSGSFVDAPACATGAPEVYVLPVQFSDNGDGYPVIGLQALAEPEADGSGWTVRLFLFREDAADPGTDERVQLDAVHGRAAVFTWCP